MEIVFRDIRNYKTLDGDEICEEWIKKFQDKKTQGIIRKRIQRLRLANYDNYKGLAEDLYELKIPYGPGYRVYFGMVDSRTVILLCGGTKKTQKWDIPKAQESWDEFRGRADE